MTNICLNMIVRNEDGRILRALEAAAPYISSYYIVDTGSTDATVEVIKAFFDERGTPGIVSECEFVNFSQARNHALARARTMLGCQKNVYILLQDADMELCAAPGAFEDLTAPAYNMIQKSGPISYHNTRLIRADAPGEYLGVTHEYLNVDGIEELTGPHFIDHADGSNRADKFPRDIKLLTEALKTEPDNARYWFYLGQSYRDAGRPHKAVEAYGKRVALGGWDEETWNATCNIAAAFKDMNCDHQFVTKMLEAYNMRPTRAEPLYDIAKHYRERGDHHTSLLFSQAGMEIPKPDDKLFVNDYVYTTGLREEFSICAFYSKEHRADGAHVCDALSLDPAGTDASRALAKSNMYHYLEPITAHAASFKSFGMPPVSDGAGYRATNPSIVVHNGEFLVNVRYVNYTIAPDGSYRIVGADGSISREHPIHTKNFILKLDYGFRMKSVGPVHWERPAPQFDLVIGLEDIRLISAFEGLFGVACVREQNPEGVCEQVLFQLREDVGSWDLMQYKTVSERASHEKNWMPILNNRTRAGMKTSFMYRPDVMIPNDASCAALSIVLPSSLKVDNISGSSQLVPFNAGYLAVLHESGHIPGTSTRYYQHRFAWFDKDYRLHRLSLPFVFEAKQIEFCAGLAIHPETNQVVVSYGVRDEIAKLATINAVDVQQMLWCYYD